MNPNNLPEIHPHDRLPPTGESPECKAERLLYIARLTPKQRQQRLERATRGYN
jgi:hypothetical protein